MNYDLKGSAYIGEEEYFQGEVKKKKLSLSCNASF